VENSPKTKKFKHRYIAFMLALVLIYVFHTADKLGKNSW